MTQSAEERPGARITDEGIAKMRERIGVVVPQPPPFNVEATTDGMRGAFSGTGGGNGISTRSNSAIFCGVPDSRTSKSLIVRSVTARPSSSTTETVTSTSSTPARKTARKWASSRIC